MYTDQRTIVLRRASLHTVAVMSCCISFAGCDTGPQTYQVTGTISYQGKPVSGGLINFRPPKGQPLGGAIKEGGTYSFSLPAGQYQVRIETPPKIPEGWKEGDPDPMLGPLEVPAKFAQFGSSGLTLSVDDSGPKEKDFDLE